MERRHAKEIILEKKKREEDKLHHEKQLNEAARQIVESENKRIEENQRQQGSPEQQRQLEEIERQHREAERKRSMDSNAFKDASFDIVEHKKLIEVTIPPVIGLRQLTIPVRGKDLGVRIENEGLSNGPIQLSQQLLKRPSDIPPIFELPRGNEVNR